MEKYILLFHFTKQELILLSEDCAVGTLAMCTVQSVRSQILGSHTDIPPVSVPSYLRRHGWMMTSITSHAPKLGELVWLHTMSPHVEPAVLCQYIRISVPYFFGILFISSCLLIVLKN